MSFALSKILLQRRYDFRYWNCLLSISKFLSQVGLFCEIWRWWPFWILVHSQPHSDVRSGTAAWSSEMSETKLYHVQRWPELQEKELAWESVFGQWMLVLVGLDEALSAAAAAYEHQTFCVLKIAHLVWNHLASCFSQKENSTQFVNLVNISNKNLMESAKHMKGILGRAV